jgi:hypothetical protein
MLKRYNMTVPLWFFSAIVWDFYYNQCATNWFITVQILQEFKNSIGFHLKLPIIKSQKGLQENTNLKFKFMYAFTEGQGRRQHRSVHKKETGYVNGRGSQLNSIHALLLALYVWQAMHFHKQYLKKCQFSSVVDQWCETDN